MMDTTHAKPGNLILASFLLEIEDGKPVAVEWGRLTAPENRRQK